MTHDGRETRRQNQNGDAHSEAELDRRLDALLAELEIEPAPPSLRRRLRRIPHTERGTRSVLQRLFAPGPVRTWALGPAFAMALLAIGLVALLPREPSEEEILRARQELALAFSYVDKAGVMAGREIHSALGGELRHALKDNLSRHIPFTEQSRKEETT